MIEFNCQHCGKLLRLNDSYAGRDGWCRVCKRMVIVPDGGKLRRVEDLPAEEGYVRLQRLLQYAATKADQYKMHLARQAGEERLKAQLESTARDAKDALAMLELRCGRLEAELNTTRAALAAAEERAAALAAAGDSGVVPASGDSSELAAALALERENRAALEARAAELEAQLRSAEEASLLRDSEERVLRAERENHAVLASRVAELELSLRTTEEALSAQGVVEAALHQERERPPPSSIPRRIRGRRTSSYRW